MSNPFFNAMGGRQPIPGPMGNTMNMMQMLQQFQQFKNSFQGDPKAEVERLVREGRISQQQLNQVQQLASQFASMLPK